MPNDDRAATRDHSLAATEAAPSAAPVTGCPEHLLPAFVVLSRSAETNSYRGVTERSFSMDRDPDRVLICVSQKNAQSAVLNVLAGREVSFDVSGERQARDLASKPSPGETLEVFDISDPALPINIDWAAWWADNAYCDKTISGVRDKYLARNAPFTIREPSDNPLGQQEEV